MVTLKGMRVTYNVWTDQLTFYDGKGQKILEEVAYTGREMTASSLVDGTNSWKQVSQSFVSPKDEFLFGTGQFQDGYLNIRGLTRRLTQVNTQIAVPFVLSSKGYGLLWNNYGLTDFNPSTGSVKLQGTDEQGNVIEVNTTSTTGNLRERRVSDTFKADITLDEDGDYAFLLDVGQTMARKLYLAIDGQPVIDLNNMWLPPTGSAMMHLSKGRHQITVKGVRGDSPTVSWRKAQKLMKQPERKSLIIFITCTIGLCLKVNILLTGSCVFSTGLMILLRLKELNLSADCQ